MTQYTTVVESHRRQMEQELWEKKVNYMVAEKGVLKIIYNNGKTRYQATRDLNGRKKNQVWWENSAKTNADLKSEFRHNEADRMAQFENVPIRDLAAEQDKKRKDSLRIRLGKWLLKDGQ